MRNTLLYTITAKLEECVPALQERRAYLTRVRDRGEVVETMFALRADLLRNLGNMTNAELHEHFPVVPEPIQTYIQEVTDGLRDVTFSPGGACHWHMRCDRHACSQSQRHCWHVKR